MEQKTKGGVTPLMKAAEASSWDCVAFLLQKGADPGATDNFGRTAHQYAAALDPESKISESLLRAEKRRLGIN